MDNQILGKSEDFAVRIIKLYRYLTVEKNEYVMSKQLLRCGTSIGANVCEAQYGQSRADFRTKMQVALKEANETAYWLRLLYKTDYLSEVQFRHTTCEIHELLRLLTAICKSTASNEKQPS